MSIADSILPELEQEAATTKRVLERVPTDKLDYCPGPKAMTLGQLAYHVATIPGGIASFLNLDTFEVPDFGNPPAVGAAAELLPLLDGSVAQAKELLGQWDDARMLATFSVTNGGKTVLAAPRIGIVRSIMLNHWYHHRGQLSTYLRALDVPLPSIYGPSADENPFA
ncbi:MAG: DinB family protein [Acidobacteria bacterium]|nr:DinB family protein [Acidobacteriota bacterium]MBI3421695.1 DinB family protein [Acidobacteriota bacterium]